LDVAGFGFGRAEAAFCWKGELGDAAERRARGVSAEGEGIADDVTRRVARSGRGAETRFLKLVIGVAEGSPPPLSLEDKKSLFRLFLRLETEELVLFSFAAAEDLNGTAVGDFFPRLDIGKVALVIVAGEGLNPAGVDNSPLPVCSGTEEPCGGDKSPSPRSFNFSPSLWTDKVADVIVGAESSNPPPLGDGSFGSETEEVEVDGAKGSFTTPQNPATMSGLKSSSESV
jgi:hypothetical protein